MTKLNLKKLFKTMNETVEKSRWDKRKIIKVTDTGFNPMHQLDRGRNGVSSTLSLQSVIVEAKAILFERSSKSTLQMIYVNSEVKTSHGFGSDKSYLVKIRKDNKTIDFQVHNSDNRDSLGRMHHIFGYDLSKVMPTEFESFKKYHGKSENFESEFTDSVYSDAVSNYEIENAMQDDSALTKLCSVLGFKLLSVFEYTHRYWVSPKYIKTIKKGVEFGWLDVGTYNTLPRTLRIELVNEVKTVMLSDLGIESEGYYSHDDNMRILPDEAKRAKSFHRHFVKTEKQVTESILQSVEK